MEDPLVSVIIPAKNEEVLLSSVLTHLRVSIDVFAGACEVILVDNGSTDATCDVAVKQNCTIVVEPYLSIAGLRNLGARLARGSVLAFLDADCLVDPNWMKYCVERLSDRKIGIVGTRAVPDFNNATWVEEGWFGLVSGVERPDYPRWIGSSNMFIRKDVFDEIGGFNESLVTAEDVDICTKAAQKYKICLEKRICTIHLRESKTVMQMVKREVWRGKSSIRQILISSDKINEAKGLVIPMTVNILSGLTFIGLFQDTFYKWSFVLIVLLPLVMIVYKKAIFNNVTDFKNVYVVSLIYLLSRTFAMIEELFIITGPFAKRCFGSWNSKQRV